MGQIPPSLLSHTLALIYRPYTQGKKGEQCGPRISESLKTLRYGFSESAWVPLTLHSDGDSQKNYMGQLAWARTGPAGMKYII
jgi:hypothetical protein